jgi:polyhydroxyalkanoate synthesis regulator phasin
MAQKRKPKPKNVDLTVKSVADLMLADPRMGVSDALQQHGLKLIDVTRDRLHQIVKEVTERGWMPDEVARVFVQSVRRLGLTQALELGDNESAKMWADAIASEPGVGLTQRAAGIEVNIDLGDLSGKLRDALNEPAPYLTINGSSEEKE